MASDDTDTDTETETEYECLDCGTVIGTLTQPDHCPDCGGRMESRETLPE